jgi:putative Mg2+ transporter-C (MgtC) family protein
MPETEPLHPSVDLADIALRLLAAVIVGVAIGFDREFRGKPAGMRTLALVALGAALVSLTTIHLEALEGDPGAISRVVSGIIEGVMTGIGFLGAGAILKRESSGVVEGLTTAATVWVTAALGIACAIASWRVVAVGVGLTLIVLVVLHPLDNWLEKRGRKTRAPDLAG